MKQESHDFSRVECQYVNTKNAKWINIFSGDNLAGFLIIGRDSSEKDSTADFSIAQAYIAPDYRRKGLMTKEASQYLYHHPGNVSLLVFEKNTYALRFWSWLFEENGYVNYKIDSWDDEELLCLGYSKTN